MSQPLRVYSYQNAPADEAPHRNLRFLFERVWLPARQASRSRPHEKTVRSIRETISWWERLTEDPAIAEIDELACDGFLAELAEQPGRGSPRMSEASINKHGRNLNQLLRFAASPLRWRPGKPPILPRLVKAELTRPDQRPPSGHLTVDQVRTLVAHCRRWPPPARETAPGAPHGLIWRALLLLDFYTGLRPGALVRLAWEDFREDPQPDGPPGARLHVRDEISKRRRGQVHWVHPIAWAALAPLAGFGSHVFAAWPRLVDEATHESAKSSLSRALRSHAARCGVQFARGKVWKASRMTHATLVAGDSRMLEAQLSLGHASSVLALHYTDSIAVLRAAVLKMPDVDAPPAAAEQLRLF